MPQLSSVILNKNNNGSTRYVAVKCLCSESIYYTECLHLIMESKLYSDGTQAVSICVDKSKNLDTQKILN